MNPVDFPPLIETSAGPSAAKATNRRLQAVVRQTGQSQMRSSVTWFVILAGACVAGPYLLGVRPTTRRHWVYLAITLAFLVWVLPLMASLRSR